MLIAHPLITSAKIASPIGKLGAMFEYRAELEFLNILWGLGTE
jgi:hypothetical protein